MTPWVVLYHPWITPTPAQGLARASLLQHAGHAGPVARPRILLAQQRLALVVHLARRLMVARPHRRVYAVAAGEGEPMRLGQERLELLRRRRPRQGGRRRVRRRRAGERVGHIRGLGRQLVGGQRRPHLERELAAGHGLGHADAGQLDHLLHELDAQRLAPRLGRLLGREQVDGEDEVVELRGDHLDRPQQPPLEVGGVRRLRGDQQALQLARRGLGRAEPLRLCRLEGLQLRAPVGVGERGLERRLVHVPPLGQVGAPLLVGRAQPLRLRLGAAARDCARCVEGDCGDGGEERFELEELAAEQAALGTPVLRGLVREVGEQGAHAPARLLLVGRELGGARHLALALAGVVGAVQRQQSLLRLEAHGLDARHQRARVRPGRGRGRDRRRNSLGLPLCRCCRLLLALGLHHLRNCHSSGDDWAAAVDVD
mmetsp:Transcript_24676/g.57073  ORF Transcript_24676/g.57073 Transcript_24676/m.57073 type:complete len:428 (+) Transcript_24676:152-1435(+)